MSIMRSDPERIDDLVDRAWRIGQQIDGCLNDIEQLVDTLQIEWDGDRHEVREMSAALIQLESTVRAARDRYLGNISHNSRT